MQPGTSEPAAPGESGELVLTNLGRLGFPLIRYHTGDLVKPAANSADDCCFLFLEHGILGRTDDMITVRGVNIYPSAIDNLVRQFEQISEYRATVNKHGELDELTIEVAPHADSKAAKESLRGLIKKSLGLRANIEIAEPNTLPRFEHKARRFHVQR
jgi:phenylacetate-CoA ligase